MERNLSSGFVFGMLLVLLMTACVNGENDTDNLAEPEDITLTMQYSNAEVFEERIKAPVEEALPHITLELMHASDGDPQDLEEHITAGVLPDIIYMGNMGNLQNMLDYDLAYNMEELIERHNFDLSRIEPTLIESVRSFAPDGELYTLPMMRNSYILYYNMDIFDLFGVDYPSDGMTWEEVLALAREVTGEEDGTLYHGLQTPSPERIADALNVAYVDPQTDEPLHTSSEAVRRFLEVVEQVSSIPGNVPEEDPISPFLNQNSFVEGRSAMMALWNTTHILSLSDEELGFRLDIAQYPQFADNMGIQPETRGNQIGVAATSEHKDEAFEVVAYILSDAYQSWQAESYVVMSSLADDAINRNYYGAGSALEERNMDAFFGLTPAPGPERRSPYDSIGTMASEMIEGVVEEGKDINTVLREVEELAAIEIQRAKEFE